MSTRVRERVRVRVRDRDRVRVRVVSGKQLPEQKTDIPFIMTDTGSRL